MPTIRTQQTFTFGSLYQITYGAPLVLKIGTVGIYQHTELAPALKTRVTDSSLNSSALLTRVGDQQDLSAAILASTWVEQVFEPDLVLDDSFVFTSRNTVYNEVRSSTFFTNALYKRLVKLNPELCSWVGKFSISSATETVQLVLENQLLSYTRVMKALSLRNALKEDLGPATSLNYSVRIMLGSSDVTSKIKSASISYNMDSYCGECDITWADWTMFSELDVSSQSYFAKERIEIFTKINDEAEVSQGKFLIEKRSTSATAEGITLNSWGRSRTALLGEPYASPVDTTWGETSLTYIDKTVTPNVSRTISPTVEGGKLKWRATDIVTMLANREGISVSWDSQVYQFRVLPYKLDVGTELPIEVITRLAEVVGALVTTDRTGVLKIMYHYDMPAVV